MMPKPEAAARLREAVALIERFCPASRDKAEVLCRLNFQIAVLRRSNADRICRRCQATFVWTANEQRAHEALGWSAPTHCLKCRSARRHVQGAGDASGQKSLR